MVNQENASRVFVTGMASITSCGNSLTETWEHVLAGRHGLADADDLPHWAGKTVGALKNFEPARVLPDRKLLKVISKHDAMGIAAACAAVTQSGLVSWRDALPDATAFNDATGIYVGSPGNKYFQQDDFLPLTAASAGNMQDFAQQLFGSVHPMWLLRILPNNVLAYTGMTFQFKGPNHNIVNHAVSSAQALIEAYHAVQSGQIARAVVVGYDTPIEPQSLLYYQKLGVISPTTIRPFDAAHDGTILGEGAAAVVIESEASVRLRNASCIAEILAGHATTEGTGLFAIQESAEALADLISHTLDRAGLSPDLLDCVVAHGNGNPRSDDSEAYAIQRVFGDYRVPVTGFKSATGHLVAASGLSDGVLMLQSLQERILPGIACFTRPAHAAQPLGLTSEARPLPERAKALLINRGFASMNACLIMAACSSWKI